MKKLVVSFSGGETSAFMAQWLWQNKKLDYDMKFIFANTGAENEETLVFIDRCSKFFGFPVVWLESEPIHIERKGTQHRVVDFKTASRDGEPFERVVKKYGIPNQAFPHCTRELKLAPIRSYMKATEWQDAETAIGIRVDEFDRMSASAKENRLVYPLISWLPTTKPQINTFWRDQPFRLELKGYQGNCVTCWKKSDAKLYKIAQENPRAFNLFDGLEKQYGEAGSEKRKAKMAGRKMTFFRRGRSALDILTEAKTAGDFSVIDDASIYENESCDVYTECV